MGKDHLDRARATKDDEFYTLYSDVEKIFNIITNKKDYHFILPFNETYNMEAKTKNIEDYIKENKLIKF